MAECQTVRDRHGASGDVDAGQRTYLSPQLPPHRPCSGGYGQRISCIYRKAGMSDGRGSPEAFGGKGEKPCTGYGRAGGPFL